MYLPHHYDEKPRMRKRDSGEEEKQHIVLGETQVFCPTYQMKAIHEGYTWRGCYY